MLCCGPRDCGEAYESNLEGVYFRFCAGSRCMAWQWSDTFKDNGSPVLEGVGYCGLAKGKTNV